MKKGQKINWKENESQVTKIQLLGTLDESDAHLYKEVIQNLQNDEKKSVKKKEAPIKEEENPLKISEYYQNFKKNSNHKELSSNRTLQKNFSNGMKNFQKLAFKDFSSLKPSLRFSAGSGKSNGPQKLFSSDKLKSTKKFSCTSKKQLLLPKPTLVFGKKSIKFSKKEKNSSEELSEKDVWKWVHSLTDRKLDKFVSSVNECKLTSLPEPQRWKEEAGNPGLSLFLSQAQLYQLPGDQARACIN